MARIFCKVYDAVVEAYQFGPDSSTHVFCRALTGFAGVFIPFPRKGLCSRIGISHPNADVKTVLQAKQDERDYCAWIAWEILTPHEQMCTVSRNSHIFAHCSPQFQSVSFEPSSICLEKRSLRRGVRRSAAKFTSQAAYFLHPDCPLWLLVSCTAVSGRDLFWDLFEPSQTQSADARLSCVPTLVQYFNMCEMDHNGTFGRQVWPSPSSGTVIRGLCELIPSWAGGAPVFDSCLFGSFSPFRIIFQLNPFSQHRTRIEAMGPKRQAAQALQLVQDCRAEGLQATEPGSSIVHHCTRMYLVSREDLVPPWLQTPWLQGLCHKCLGTWRARALCSACSWRVCWTCQTIRTIPHFVESGFPEWYMLCFYVPLEWKLCRTFRIRFYKLCLCWLETLHRTRSSRLQESRSGRYTAANPTGLMLWLCSFSRFWRVPVPVFCCLGRTDERFKKTWQRIVLLRWGNICAAIHPGSNDAVAGLRCFQMFHLFVGHLLSVFISKSQSCWTHDLTMCLKLALCTKNRHEDYIWTTMNS